MVKSRIFLVLSLILVVFGSSRADAGDLHRHQSVCDGAELVGAAYGACHVYCEALDCDGPPKPRRARACERALDRFWELTGEPPPCDPICPCAAGWLNPAFVPADLQAVECSVQINDFGEFIDLRLEGGPDENGDEPLSAAGVNIFDDGLAGFHSLGCFSERYENQSFVLSEDSGVFEMFSGFRDEGDDFDRQQTTLFASCKTVLMKMIDDTGAECLVDDTTGQ